MPLVPHDPRWNEKYSRESKRIRATLGDKVLDIQHIGSTAIKGILSKPIIDIAVLLETKHIRKNVIEPLKKIGYTHYPESSSVERIFFRKGDPVAYHLSLVPRGRTSYWERQLQFRDFLNAHPEYAKKYEGLKQKLIKADPTARQAYSDGKTEFVKKILERAKKPR